MLTFHSLQIVGCRLTCVLLLVLREHFGDRDKGLDLHHVLFADVIQLLKVSLADMVNSSQIPE